MATLDQLKRSITELTRDEAFQLVLGIRANRRIQKKNFFKQPKARTGVTKKAKNEKALNNMSTEQKLELLKKLQEQNEGA
jgi:hypothetical protein